MRRIAILLILVLVCVGLLGQTGAFSASSTRVYLPLVSKQEAQGSSAYRVNIPRLSDEASWKQLAIFWFGQVTPTSNYADVRVGYTDEGLYVRLAAFDRYLWYDTTPSAGELTAWDAATLYLDLGGNVGSTPGNKAYRFVAMLSWWEKNRSAFQTAYRGNGAGWVSTPVTFITETGWRGNAPNDGLYDRGWSAVFRIPFASLGLSGPPPEGTVWGMGLTLHDRDDAAGTPIADQKWPPTLDAGKPATWGQLAFALPVYSPPSATPRETVTIRHKLNGAVVPDAAVGGTTQNLCPGDEDYIWNQWGNRNFAGAPDFNIQNQGDVADWPCFAKYYVKFPLDAVPAGKVVLSATLNLHQFGNSKPSGAKPSWIQVLTTDRDWDEPTITWNNAPLARENIGGAWVDPLTSWPPWPGVPRTWDVSRAVADAYAAGRPVSLVLYSADWDYHSGKHLVSSDTGDWNAAGRPTLQVVWGDP